MIRFFCSGFIPPPRCFFVLLVFFVLFVTTRCFVLFVTRCLVFFVLRRLVLWRLVLCFMPWPLDKSQWVAQTDCFESVKTLGTLG